MRPGPRLADSPAPAPRLEPPKRDDLDVRSRTLASQISTRESSLAAPARTKSTRGLGCGGLPSPARLPVTLGTGAGAAAGPHGARALASLGSSLILWAQPRWRGNPDRLLPGAPLCTRRG